MEIGYMSERVYEVPKLTEKEKEEKRFGDEMEDFFTGKYNNGEEDDVLNEHDEIGDWHVGSEADVGHGPWDFDNHPPVMGEANFIAPKKTPRHAPKPKLPPKLKRQEEPKLEQSPKRHRKTSTENDALEQAYKDMDLHMNSLDIQKMEPKDKQNILGLVLSELHIDNTIDTIKQLKIKTTIATNDDITYIQKINIPVHVSVSGSTSDDPVMKGKLERLYDTFISHKGKSDKSWIDLLARVRKWAELLSDEKSKKGGKSRRRRRHRTTKRRSHRRRKHIS